ncbi:MAG TPA: pantoate--beta-alanine ligase [Xanthobacteraceae bacterium]|nr:pantoate--beta-alanine ligase [Xanthobacteraceae bacterium]
MTARSTGSAHRPRPRVARTLPALGRALEKWRARRETIALVPTMGALHEGHLALVRLAQRRADRVVVSIFVNPAQFAPQEDLKTYPRTLTTDVAALAKLKTDLVWAPAVATMYPEGFATRIILDGPARAGLEDAFRPHFFAGVATVVGKLLIQCRPDVAVFGEKDFQQLKVVARLSRDLNLSTRIVGAPTVREADGLALSSRNRYLSADERAAAPTLHRVLTDCAKKIAAGGPIASALSAGRAEIAKAGFALDYLEARHAETLAPLASAKQGPLRLLVAARIGKTRLIDNVGV